MIHTNILLLAAVAGAVLLDGCGIGEKEEAGVKPSLKELYKDDFLIGPALSAVQLNGRDTVALQLTLDHFNAVTPENVMKAEVLHPEPGRYDFTMADKLVEFATENSLIVNAHTLIWHQQLPEFVHNIQDVDSFRQFFTEHINTVSSRYDGKVYSWDVVNEALNEDGSLRNSIFLEKLGEEYIVEAFRLAQHAAPNTKLYYNDYNIEQPAKRAGAIKIIKKIQDAGVRIDGVGIQGHWNIAGIPLRNIEESIIEFSDLGIEVMFTELDISVLPNPWDNNTAEISQTAEYDAKMNPFSEGLPDSIQTKLADSYEQIFRLFLKHRDKVSRVTFWGVHDGQSWLNNWPIRGRTNYPLVFDRQGQSKEAFYRITDLKNKP